MMCAIILADALKSIDSAENREHRPLLGWTWGIQFLIVKKHCHIDKFDITGNCRAGRISVNLAGRLNECDVLTLRFDI